MALMVINLVGLVLLSGLYTTSTITLGSTGDWSSEVCFKLDLLSLTYGLLLVLTTLLVVMFCIHYHGRLSQESLSLCLYLVGFSVVVWLLTMTDTLLATLIWWDYLGIVSFMLILRNNNKDSVFSSLIVLLSGRFGDVSLFCLIGVYYYFGLTETLSCVFVDLLVIFVVFSKSPSYPLISWLVEAMRADTSISSLVHSATLVTAGVWFSCRYTSIAAVSGNMVIFILSLALFSIYATAIMSFVENDLKKCVAYSTCNNMAWCILFCYLGFYGAAVCQLVSHGLLKSVCFVIVGVHMGENSSDQNWYNCYGDHKEFDEFLYFLVILISLGGFPCFGLFYIKHSIICLAGLNGGSVMSVFIILGSLLSAVYTSRFVGLLTMLGNFSRMQCFSYPFNYWFISVVINLVFDSLWYVMGGYGEEITVYGYNGWTLVCLFMQLYIGFIIHCRCVGQLFLFVDLIQGVLGLNHLLNVWRNVGLCWIGYSLWFLLSVENLLYSFRSFNWITVNYFWRLVSQVGSLFIIGVVVFVVLVGTSSVNSLSSNVDFGDPWFLNGIGWSN